MKPFYFGENPRRLYGVYQQPDDLSVEKGVVLCSSWGQEAINAHRTLKHLSEQLAAAQFHTLRFDYFGSGDSYGESEEVRVERWVEDTVIAVEELMDNADIDEITLVGMRLGGAVAAKAIANEIEVDNLVLWDPVIDGHAYLKEYLTLAGFADEQHGAILRSNLIEILGFPLPLAMTDEIKKIEKNVYTADLPDTLLVSTAHDKSCNESFRVHLEQLDVSVEVAEFDLSPPWQKKGEFGSTGLPKLAIEHIVGWCK